MTHPHAGPNAVSVNGRTYAWPRRPTIVVCVDGSEPAYIEEAVAADVMPFTAGMLRHGADLRADCVMPSFTNPNNLSIVTGVPPAVHGICGNYYLDPVTGAEVMMNDPSLLRCETLLAAFARAGAQVAVVTAKDKLRALLGRGLPVSAGQAVCFSAEKADQARAETHGISDVPAFVGMPVPPVYSAELSEFVLAAGTRLLEDRHWDLMYLSTTDYVQHKHAPGTPAANAFYAMLDFYLAKLDALGATVAVTADHGMKPKHDADGRPRVVYLQSLLDERLGAGQTRVILPITDPYVIHHGALGSFAVVYLGPGVAVTEAQEQIAAIDGIDEVLPRDAACARFDLPPDREGDLVVISAADCTLGTRPERHDLGQLVEPLRSHGGTSEQRVPMLLNRPCGHEPAQRALRNFDAFHLALNRVA